jgi:hypothetical protein
MSVSYCCPVALVNGLWAKDQICRSKWGPARPSGNNEECSRNEICRQGTKERRCGKLSRTGRGGSLEGDAGSLAACHVGTERPTIRTAAEASQVGVRTSESGKLTRRDGKDDALDADRARDVGTEGKSALAAEKSTRRRERSATAGDQTTSWSMRWTGARGGFEPSSYRGARQRPRRPRRCRADSRRTTRVQMLYRGTEVRGERVRQPESLTGQSSKGLTS